MQRPKYLVLTELTCAGRDCACADGADVVAGGNDADTGVYDDVDARLKAGPMEKLGWAGIANLCDRCCLVSDSGASTRIGQRVVRPKVVVGLGASSRSAGIGYLIPRL